MAYKRSDLRKKMTAEEYEQMKTQKYLEQIADSLMELHSRRAELASNWHKPWANISNFNQINGLSEKAYRGKNGFSLWLASYLKGYQDPRWVTYKQVEEEGGNVRRGEKGVLIKFFSDSRQVDVRDEQGNLVYDENGKVKQKTEKTAPKVVFTTVFNLAQCENIPETSKLSKPVIMPKLDHLERVERAEHFLKACGAKIYHDSDHAYYNPAFDDVHLPPHDLFDSPSDYYHTAFHEVTHWTGAPSRCNRFDKVPSKGSVSYAREEFVADLGAHLISRDFNLVSGSDMEKLMGYLGGWFENIARQDRENPEKFRQEVVRALEASIEGQQYLNQAVRAYDREHPEETQAFENRIDLNIENDEQMKLAVDNMAVLDPESQKMYITYDHDVTLFKGLIDNYDEVFRKYQLIQSAQKQSTAQEAETVADNVSEEINSTSEEIRAAQEKQINAPDASVAATQSQSQPQPQPQPTQPEPETQAQSETTQSESQSQSETPPAENSHDNAAERSAFDDLKYLYLKGDFENEDAKTRVFKFIAENIQVTKTSSIMWSYENKAKSNDAAWQPKDNLGVRMVGQSFVTTASQLPSMISDALHTDISEAVEVKPAKYTRDLFDEHIEKLLKSPGLMFEITHAEEFIEKNILSDFEPDVEQETEAINREDSRQEASAEEQQKQEPQPKENAISPEDKAMYGDMLKDFWNKHSKLHEDVSEWGEWNSVEADLVKTVRIIQTHQDKIKAQRNEVDAKELCVQTLEKSVIGGSADVSMSMFSACHDEGFRQWIGDWAYELIQKHEISLTPEETQKLQEEQQKQEPQPEENQEVAAKTALDDLQYLAEHGEYENQAAEKRVETYLENNLSLTISNDGKPVTALNETYQWDHNYTGPDNLLQKSPNSWMRTIRGRIPFEDNFDRNDGWKEKISFLYPLINKIHQDLEFTLKEKGIELKKIERTGFSTSPETEKIDQGWMDNMSKTLRGIMPKIANTQAFLETKELIERNKQLYFDHITEDLTKRSQDPTWRVWTKPFAETKFNEKGGFIAPFNPETNQIFSISKKSDSAVFHAQKICGLLNDPRWATQNYIVKEGGSIKKGAARVPIFDKSLQRVTQYVYNIEQCENFPDTSELSKPYIPVDFEKYKAKTEADPCMKKDAKIDDFLNQTGAIFGYGGARPCYSPHHNMISLPYYEYFYSPGEYYHATFHELTHWTKHNGIERKIGLKDYGIGKVSVNSRNKDDSNDSREKIRYGLEEITADMGALLHERSFNLQSEKSLNTAASYVLSFYEKIKTNIQKINATEESNTQMKSIDETMKLQIQDSYAAMQHTFSKQKDVEQQYINLSKANSKNEDQMKDILSKGAALNPKDPRYFCISYNHDINKFKDYINDFEQAKTLYDEKNADKQFFAVTSHTLWSDEKPSKLFHMEDDYKSYLEKETIKQPPEAVERFPTAIQALEDLRKNYTGEMRDDEDGVSLTMYSVRPVTFDKDGKLKTCGNALEIGGCPEKLFEMIVETARAENRAKMEEASREKELTKENTVSQTQCQPTPSLSSGKQMSLFGEPQQPQQQQRRRKFGR